MVGLLQIVSGATGPESVSNSLADDAVRALSASVTSVVRRDLDLEPLPHISSRTVAALGRGAIEGTGGVAEARRRSDMLIAELRAAEILVIAAPMYNYGIASTLKAWFDHVIRAGETFDYTPAGPRGTLSGRSAIICSARGARYDGEATGLDCVTPHVAVMLGVMGITEVAWVRAEGLRLGPDAHADGMAAARQSLAAAVSRIQLSLG